MIYPKEERLLLTKKVRITPEAYTILRDEKKRLKRSMAKIVSELIINYYNK